MPTTIEELLEKSKQCYNYNSYTPEHWDAIACKLSSLYGFNGAYAVLDSKHMRWCEDQTSIGFTAYMNENINQAEVTFLLESY